MDVVKRLNYFDHQFLRAPDFNDEQNYHLSMRRLHNRLLHSWGIAQGLTVTVATGGTGTAVTVSAGVAIDSLGQEIVLPTATSLELGAVAAGALIYITIAYQEQQSDATTEAGGQGNTRWTEQPTPVFSTTAPADASMSLILGKVPRTATGLGSIDSSDRRLAGSSVPPDLTVNSLTLKNDGTAQSAWPKLSCTGANQAALTNGNLALDAQREIYFADNGQIRSLDNNHKLVFNHAQNLMDLYEFGDIRFLTGQTLTEKMRVQASGNVGIGTATPAQKLDVEGPVIAANGVNAFEVSTDATGTHFWTNNAFDRNKPFDNWTQTLNMENGKVGIGTSSPQTKLHVNTLTSVDEGTTAAGAWANFGSNAHYDGAWKMIDATKAGVNLHMNADDGAGQEFRFLRVEANGTNQRNLAVIGSKLTAFMESNVGIGTAAPDRPLAVQAKGPSQEILSFKDPSGATKWHFNINLGGTNPGLNIVETGVADGRLFLKAGGSVGIGTTTPAASLDVAGGLLHVGGTTAPTMASQGAYIGWNALTGGTGETDFINNQGGGTGGFAFMNTPASGSPRATIVIIDGSGRIGVMGQPAAPRTPGWGGGIHTWDLEAEGTIWARNGSQSGNRDLAENYFSDLNLEVGDVVCLDRDLDRIVPSQKPSDDLLVGVVSGEPGFLLNADPTAESNGNGKKPFPVALCGRVPCKVLDENGPIKRGDLLTSSSTPGYAMKAKPMNVGGVEVFRPSTIIGKALGSLDSGKGMIEVFVHA